MVSRLLLFCVIALATFAGCINGVPVGDMVTSEKKHFPREPQNLTDKSVQSFVEGYEKKKTLSGYSSSTSSVSCESYTESEEESAYIAYVQCMGGIELSGGDHVDVSTWSFYYVSNQSTKRLSTDNITIRNYQQGKYGNTGIQILNFDNVSHRVTVASKNKTNNKIGKVNISYTLQPKELISQNYLPYRYNTSYRVKVTVSRKTGSVILSPQRPGTRLVHSETLLILPDGSVRFMTIPPHINETAENNYTGTR